jgi:spermidine synthase
VKQKSDAIQQLVWFYAGPPRLELTEEGPFLCLYLDGILQSKMNQLVPAESISAHLSPVLTSLHQSKPESALLLGLGGGDLNRFITTTLPNTRVLTVEIEPKVIELYQRFFCLQGKEEVLAMSAQDFLQQNQQQFSYIVWDIYPLFDGWQHTLQTLLQQQKGQILINLSQPQYQQQLEALFTTRNYQCHRTEGFLNLLYQIEALAF